MAPVELRMSFDGVDALATEFETNLKFGRAFIRGEVGDVQVLSECTLVLEHPSDGALLKLGAQVVMVGGGVGIELRPSDDATQERIAGFVRMERPAAMQVQAAEASEATERKTLRPDGHTTIPPDVQPVSRQQQIRNMSMPEQQRLARGGDLTDRVSLERMLGKAVWDSLLSNPKLTVPEVAKIARKGTVPRKLLEQIIDNGSWARAAPVRRALLGNPRLGKDSVHRLLAVTPKPELKLIQKGTAYPMHIRDAAKKLIK